MNVCLFRVSDIQIAAAAAFTYPGVECSRMRARDLENRTDFLRNALL